MVYLVIQHWVAPAIAIKFGLSWRLPSLFLSSLDCFLFYSFSDMKLLRMMSTVNFNVICFYFWVKKHFLIPDSSQLCGS